MRQFDAHRGFARGSGISMWSAGSRVQVRFLPAPITKQVEPTRAATIEAYTSGRAGVCPAPTLPGSTFTVSLSTRYRPYMKLFNFPRPALRALMFGAAALAMTSTAFAHAHLVSSEPAANAEVAAPTEVTIHFTEPLEPAFSRIDLSDASGKPAAPAASQVDKGDAKAMHLALPQLTAGRYAVHWIAVATDGHRTQGDFAFIVK
jgi:methionine-rich copper-binding protein CopC